MSNQNVHVIFGTGPLGTAVMRELLRQGQPVRMVYTRGQADVPAAVEVVKGDAYSVESVTAVTTDAQIVYQCAQPAYHQWPEKFPPMQA
ncbi:MAG: NAD(P)H-binding protein, partial [Candidatus Promineifilaceae bacterium]